MGTDDLTSAPRFTQSHRSGSVSCRGDEARVGLDECLSAYISCNQASIRVLVVILLHNIVKLAAEWWGGDAFFIHVISRTTPHATIWLHTSESVWPWILAPLVVGTKVAPTKRRHVDPTFCVESSIPWRVWDCPAPWAPAVVQKTCAYNALGPRRRAWCTWRPSRPVDQITCTICNKADVQQICTP